MRRSICDLSYVNPPNEDRTCHSLRASVKTLSYDIRFKLSITRRESHDLRIPDQERVAWRRKPGDGRQGCLTLRPFCVRHRKSWGEPVKIRVRSRDLAYIRISDTLLIRTTGRSKQVFLHQVVNACTFRNTPLLPSLLLVHPQVHIRDTAAGTAAANSKDLRVTECLDLWDTTDL